MKFHVDPDAPDIITDDLLEKLGFGTYEVTIFYKDLGNGQSGSDFVVKKDGVVMPNVTAVLVSATVDDIYPTIRLIELSGITEVKE